MFSNYTIKVKLTVLFLFFLFPQTANSQERYQQLVGVTDLRSTFSTGCHSLDELALMAVRRNIDVIIVADHDRHSLEYGILPFRNLLKYKISGISILSDGAKKYLQAFERLNKKYPELIAIPAIESAPFYYWKGDLSSGLEVHGWGNHIMVVGMTGASQLEGLPTLNSNLSIKYFWKLFPKNIPFFASIVLGTFLLFAKGYLKKIGFFIILLNLLLAINYHPFRSSLFDQYHGDQGIAPWQETINYANEIGAMTFWHNLKPTTKIRKNVPINIKTEYRPENFIRSYGYTGLQIVNKNAIQVAYPDHEWDGALKQYTEGKRKNPPWGIGGNDYHCEGENGVKLTDVMTIFLVKEKTKKAVLEAMKNGKMYALRRSKRHRLSLDEFNVYDRTLKNKGISGDTIYSEGSPVISFKVSTAPRTKKDIKVDLIRSGKLIKTFKGKTPLRVSYKDNYLIEGEKIYYRLNIFGSSNTDSIVANPVFVQFSGGKISVTGEKEITRFIVMDEWGFLRAGPTVNAKITGFAETNEKLQLLGVTGERYKKKPWYQIVTKKGGKAFVWSGLVKTIIKQPSSTKSRLKALNKEKKEKNPLKETKIIKKEEKEKIAKSNKEYNRGLSLFKLQRHDAAIKTFKRFLNQYPNSDLTDDVYFWLAECYLAKKDFKRAEKHFYLVMSDYPNSVKAKKAILKRGFAMNKLQNLDTARKMFEKVIENYPYTDEAETAKNELRKLAQMERELP